MAKIHITLVGGQPAPVYKGIIDECPNKAIFVCSSSTKEQANRISKHIEKNEIKIRENNPNFTLPEFAYENFDPVDIKEISDGIKKICGKYIKDADSVSVNITSGTKPWSILFYSYFSKQANATCFYIDQNDMKYDFTDSDPVEINAPLGIDGTLNLHNIRVKNQIKLSFYDQSDIDVIPLIHEVRDYNSKQFARLTNDYSENPEKRIYDDIDINGNRKGRMKWNKDSNSFYFELDNRKLGKRVWNNNVTSTHISKLMMKTGWFELEVALLLNKWERAGSIQLNNELYFAPRFYGDSTDPTNEIDIIVEVDQKLLFVECKTGISKITDINKFNDAVKNYGGMGVKLIFFTYEPMYSNAKKKCDNARIPHFCMKDILNNSMTEEVLFDRLNEYMKATNIR